MRSCIFSTGLCSVYASMYIEQPVACKSTKRKSFELAQDRSTFFGDLKSHTVNCLNVALLPFWGVLILTPASPPAPCTLWCNFTDSDAISNFTFQRFTDTQSWNSIFTLFCHMFQRDISHQNGKLSWNGLRNILVTKQCVSWSAPRVSGLTHLCGNWQHCHGNSTPV